jgi:hypothetical protein
MSSALAPLPSFIFGAPPRPPVHGSLSGWIAACKGTILVTRNAILSKFCTPLIAFQQHPWAGRKSVRYFSRLHPAGQVLGRIAGFALLSLGWACWPKQEAASGTTAAPLALLIYNLLVTNYLAVLGIGGELVGMLLWPAVAIHAVLSIILVRTRFFSPPN